MNYDIPLEYYNGMSAYEVSKLGYDEHVSQHYTWFTDWLLGKNDNFTSATQIKTYSPLEFGLYYSKVGYENKDGDMFYNIPEEINEEVIEDESIDNVTEEIKEIYDKENKPNYNYLYFIGTGILTILIIILLLTKKKH